MLSSNPDQVYLSPERNIVVIELPGQNVALAVNIDALQWKAPDFVTNPKWNNETLVNRGEVVLAEILESGKSARVFNGAICPWTKNGHLIGLMDKGAFKFVGGKVGLDPKHGLLAGSQAAAIYGLVRTLTQVVRDTIAATLLVALTPMKADFAAQSPDTQKATKKDIEKSIRKLVMDPKGQYVPALIANLNSALAKQANMPNIASALPAEAKMEASTPAFADLGLSTITKKPRPAIQGQVATAIVKQMVIEAREETNVTIPEADLAGAQIIGRVGIGAVIKSKLLTACPVDDQQLLDMVPMNGFDEKKDDIATTVAMVRLSNNEWENTIGKNTDQHEGIPVALAIKSLKITITDAQKGFFDCKLVLADGNEVAIRPGYNPAVILATKPANMGVTVSFTHEARAQATQAVRDHASAQALASSASSSTFRPYAVASYVMAIIPKESGLFVPTQPPSAPAKGPK